MQLFDRTLAESANTVLRAKSTALKRDDAKALIGCDADIQQITGITALFSTAFKEKLKQTIYRIPGIKKAKASMRLGDYYSEMDFKKGGYHE